MNYKLLHDSLNICGVVHHFIEMLNVHNDQKIVRSLSYALKEASKTTVFYPDLLSDNALTKIFNKMMDS